MELIKGGIADKRGSAFDVNYSSLGRRLGGGQNDAGNIKEDNNYLRKGLRASEKTKDLHLVYLGDLT